jgi:hypothetical protein
MSDQTPPQASPAKVTPAALAPKKGTPAPKPVATPMEVPVTSGVPVAVDDPEQWGRVDESGTIFVTTTEGEREVGSWQAGEPDEGLAHFARRFDDLRAEAELLFARLASTDAKHTMTAATTLKESLPEATVVGDLAALDAFLDTILVKAREALEVSKKAREAQREASTARKEAIAAEAETIAEETTQWKTAGDRLRELLDEWKTIRGVDRKTDDALWKRFSKARESFNRRRGAHFAELDKQRATVKARKLEIVDEAEKLSASEDFGPTAARYRALMDEWKAAGRAQKDTDDALWKRFRAAQDDFFGRRSTVFNERDAEFDTNAKLKEELLTEADKIDPATGIDAAKAALHKIQERWEEIGKVPRDKIRPLEGRLRAVEDKVRAAGEAQWRRTDPEALARVAQFRERVAGFESQAAKARTAGDERRAKKADEQAAQWREWLSAAEQAIADR